MNQVTKQVIRKNYNPKQNIRKHWYLKAQRNFLAKKVFNGFESNIFPKVTPAQGKDIIILTLKQKHQRERIDLA